MKIDNPETGDKHFDVPDRSVIVPGLGELQNHQFWFVFKVKKQFKKKTIPEAEIFFLFKISR